MSVCQLSHFETEKYEFAYYGQICRFFDKYCQVIFHQCKEKNLCQVTKNFLYFENLKNFLKINL